MYNAAGNTNDWIELRAVGGAVNLKNWQLTYTVKSSSADQKVIDQAANDSTNDHQEELIIKFPEKVDGKKC